MPCIQLSPLGVPIPEEIARHPGLSRDRTFGATLADTQPTLSEIAPDAILVRYTIGENQARVRLCEEISLG